MPQSPCYLFKNSIEYCTVDDLEKVPSLVRGIYVLYREGKGKKMDVVYVGMSRGDNSGIKGRLRDHRRKKAEMWTHFSVFEVWDNITKDQVQELEGLFRHIYRKDTKANKLNIQRNSGTLKAIKRKGFDEWF